MTDSSGASERPTPIPPDDPWRSLVLARPDEDRDLPHVGMVGDTYTILLKGEDTAGLYCLIDMHIPPGGGPPPHRHDFEEMFAVLEGEIEFTFRGEKSTVRAGETVNIPANAPTRSTTPPTDQPGCCACARLPGRKNSSWPSASPSIAGRRRPPSSTRPPRRRSRRKPRNSPRGTGRSF